VAITDLIHNDPDGADTSKNPLSMKLQMIKQAASGEGAEQIKKEE
jgi:hypothetical protein